MKSPTSSNSCQRNRLIFLPQSVRGAGYAILVGGSNWDGAWRGLVTIVQLIGPRPYMFQSAVYVRLIYTVIGMSDRLLTQANPDPRLPHPPELRRAPGWLMCRRSKLTFSWRGGFHFKIFVCLESTKVPRWSHG